MPRCQYCGEFFTGYPGNQICDDCHEHIVGMEKEVAALIAERDARDAEVLRLVEFVEQWDKEQVATDFAMTRSGKDGWIAMRNARASVESIIERLRDEKRRLLTFRDAVDGFETALGVYENCMDAHCNVGGFCDHEAALLADAVQRKGIARTALADISEGDHANSDD